MIRVKRPEDVPEVLRTRGEAMRRRHARSVARGRRSLKFDESIWQHPTVKLVLRDAQHGKCCYCEAKLAGGHVAYGDLDHLRPKGAVRQRPGNLLRRPGYWWLAYEWFNILFTCGVCNGSGFKGNLFPLRHPKARARAPEHPLTREDPLLIDPSCEDPEALIGHREEVPYAIGNNLRARRTLEVFGLDDPLRRPTLFEQRRKTLGYLRALYRVATVEPALPQRDEAWATIKAMTRDDAEFAAMCRAWLRGKVLSS